jgi:two-component sensor histidine kinase
MIVPFPTSARFAGQPPEEACPNCAATADHDAAFRQLRHQTKNALQRILCHVAADPNLTTTAAGRAVARDLERRIHLSAAISDALFGFTRTPDKLEPRLRSLGLSVIELLCDPGQQIALSVEVKGLCPASLDETLVRVAHELIGNAVKHGMHVRLIGRIDVVVQTVAGTTTLTVSDDGWGYASEPAPGEGLALAGMLTEKLGGALRMRRDRDRTHVSLTLPNPNRRGGLAS